MCALTFTTNDSVEATNEMQPSNRIYIISPFIKGSTCFERYAAHHQEL